MRVLVVSEGKLDIGAPNEGSQGAVRILCRRVLSDALGRDVSDHELESDVLARVHSSSVNVSGYARKVELALVEARARNCNALVIVVDRDRTPGTTRRDQLREGRELAAKNHRELAERTAIGVAIETVEAWLLSDEVALNAVLKTSASIPTQPSPEKLDGAPRTGRHPKVHLQQLIARADASCTEPYDQIAEQLRLDVLEKRCPEGFAPLAHELRERCTR